MILYGLYLGGESSLSFYRYLVCAMRVKPLLNFIGFIGSALCAYIAVIKRKSVLDQDLFP